jgi:hypothetical protein
MNVLEDKKSCRWFVASLHSVVAPRLGVKQTRIKHPRIEFSGVKRTGVELPGSNFCRLG